MCNIFCGFVFSENIYFILCLRKFINHSGGARDGNSSENFIPRGIEESRNGKFTFLGDRGIWNLFLGVLGEFSRNELSQKSWKSPQNSKNFWKKNQKKFQPWIYISKFRMLGNNTKNWLVIQKNKNKNWKILTNFWKFSPFFHI